MQSYIYFVELRNLGQNSWHTGEPLQCKLSRYNNFANNYYKNEGCS